MLIEQVHYITFGGNHVEIIISSNTNVPIYEQIKSQMQELIISGELQSGEALPSMRSLAKTLHISVITVQKAYEDLQKSGFIETTIGRGTFVSSKNEAFYQEEQQKKVEEYLGKAVEAAKKSKISYEKLSMLLEVFYKEDVE